MADAEKFPVPLFAVDDDFTSDDDCAAAMDAEMSTYTMPKNDDSDLADTISVTGTAAMVACDTVCWDGQGCPSNVIVIRY